MELFIKTIEANVLDKLTSASKMDCWFWLNENDLPIDNENGGEPIPTADALQTLDDGLVDVENDYGLEPWEVNVYQQLLERLKPYRMSNPADQDLDLLCRTEKGWIYVTTSSDDDCDWSFWIFDENKALIDGGVFLLEVPKPTIGDVITCAFILGGFTGRTSDGYPPCWPAQACPDMEDLGFTGM